MRKIVIAVTMAVLPAYATAEQSNPPPRPAKKSNTSHPVTGNPCAQYGPGFAKIAGSDICVKVGGSVSVEGGGGGRR